MSKRATSFCFFKLIYTLCPRCIRRSDAQRFVGNVTCANEGSGAAYRRLADLRIFGERAARVPRAQPHRVKGEERRARAPVVPGACDNGASQKSRQKAREGLYSAATAERGKESAESLAVNSVVPTVLYMIINMRCDSN